MLIQILGTGCSKCKTLYAVAAQAAQESGVDVEVQKVEDIEQIMTYQIFFSHQAGDRWNGEGRRSHPECGRGQEDDPGGQSRVRRICTVRINGQAVTINALPLIFDHLHRQGVTAGNGSTDRLLEMVRVYHAIESDKEPLYRKALSEAYAEYCRNRMKSLVEIK